jgi:ATP-dependent exoDNAse (exonuclease V) beta subunit
VLARPNGDPASALTVCPGEHLIGEEATRRSVVWWAPQALALGAQTPVGLRRDDLIVKDVPPDILRERLDVYEAWRAQRAAAVAAASRPALDVMTATEAASTPGLPELPAPSVVTADSVQGGRPGGARFGALVHALLADVPLGEGERALAALVDTHGRILGATPEEATAARETVARVLSHPLLEAAARAARVGQCYRETPVTLRLDSGVVIEGVVDLAYRDGETFVVVDFKTDRELDAALDRYERQVAIYAAAIARSTGAPTHAVLMRV